VLFWDRSKRIPTLEQRSVFWPYKAASIIPGQNSLVHSTVSLCASMRDLFLSARSTVGHMPSGPHFTSMNPSANRGLMLGLPRSTVTALGKLRTPESIQDFVGDLPWNFELEGETAFSVNEVLRRKSAHCIEGALVAAYALWLHDQPPLLMDLGAAQGDVDHVVVLFRRGRYWGAISKSNSPFLRYRDPIYRSLRELSLSYFPQYFKLRRKTLRTYSIPVDLRRYDPSLWVTRAGFCCEIVDALTAARHYSIVPPEMEKNLRQLDSMEAQANLIKQCKAPAKRSGVLLRKPHLGA